MLCVAGADVEARDELGRTPIMCAAWVGHLNVSISTYIGKVTECWCIKAVRYLARLARSNVEARSRVGMTALHFAARYNNESCVLALLQEFGHHNFIQE